MESITATPPRTVQGALPLQQGKLLNYIARFHDEHGVPPSGLEMCQALGIKRKSPNAYVRALLKKRLLKYAVNAPKAGRRGTSRNVVVAPDGHEWLKKLDGQVQLTPRSHMIRYAGRNTNLQTNLMMRRKPKREKESVEKPFPDHSLPLPLEVAP